MDILGRNFHGISKNNENVGKNVNDKAVLMSFSINAFTSIIEEKE